MKREIIEIGSILRDKRISQNISLESASSSVKIMQKYLQALEDEQFSVIPADVVVKGFLKIYSEYLGIDPAPLVLEYTRRCAKNPPLTKVKSVQPPPKNAAIIRSNKLLLILGLSVLIVILIYLLFFALSRAAKIAGDQAVNKKRAAFSSAVSKDKLKIEVEIVAPTWVRVQTDGRTIFGGMLYSGNKKYWSAKRKIWMKIGNAAGIRVKSKSKILLSPGGSGKVISVQFLK